IGVARGALTATLEYAKERKQFGKAIGQFQAVQFQLAQAATELEAARLMVYNAARLETAGEPYTTQAAMAKLFASQVAERVTSLAVELFGGYGYNKEYRVENSGRDYVVWYRRGNRGRGRGKGPPVKMVIHRTEDRVVFLSVPSAILVDIDVRLRM